MSDRHIPSALPDLSIKLFQDTSVYNAISVLAPIKKVSKITDKYFIYDTTEAFREGSTIRADRTEANMMNAKALSTASYTLRNHAQKQLITDLERGNADPSVNPEVDAVEEIMNVLLLDREIDLAKSFFTVTAIATNKQILTSNAWDYDTLTSDPLVDIADGIKTILKSSGKKANNALCGYNTFHSVLKNHSDVLDRIKWSERGVITEDLFAGLIGIKNFVVNEVVRQTLAMGTSATTNFVFDNAFVLTYNDSNPKIRTANLGITFSGFYGDAIPEETRYRAPQLKGDIIEMNWMYQVKPVMTLSGYLIGSAHS